MSAATAPAVEDELERHRRALTGYCYRMLGSGFEAEDAVQETLVRAWRKIDGLEERAALKSWLYRIATNVCLDMLQGAQRRARPMDLQESTVTEAASLDVVLPESAWVQPVADGKILPESGDPAAVAESRETVKLAFVAALQHLPPKQRAVLILREVLRWRATEVAELLDTSVPSVNSALQRARATLDGLDLEASDGTASVEDAEHRALLDRYVDAFERYDVAALVGLIAEDATFSMPPMPLWIRGPEEIGKWLLGPGIECKDAKVLQTRANGCPAIAVYKPSRDEPGVWTPFNLMLLELGDGAVRHVHNFLFPELFEACGLPMRLEGDVA